MKKNVSRFILLALLFCSLSAMSCRGRKILFCGADGVQTSLVPVGGTAADGILSAAGGKNNTVSAYYRFADAAILSAAVEISVDMQNAENAVLYAGYLTAGDFDKRGKLLPELAERPLAAVTGVSGYVAVAMALPETRPAGIAVTLVGAGAAASSAATARIVSAAAVEPRAGWELRGDGSTACAFSGAGGMFDAAACRYQNRAARPADGTPSAVWQLEITVAGTPARPVESGGVAPPQHAVFRTSGGVDSELSVIVPPETYTGIFPGTLFRAPFDTLTCAAGAESVRSVFFVPAEPAYRGASDFSGDLQPIFIDPGLIPSVGTDSWRRRDYELYAWDRFPQVLIFDTATYGVQSAFFKRLAFFVEKAGYRGTLLTDDEMRGKHGYNAHDYRAESLAEFFTAAHRARFPLNRHEMTLRDILITRGVIQPGADGFSAGTGAVISISKDSSLFLRKQFLVHESLHGIYFTDAEFRRAVHEVYSALPDYAVTFMETYFSAMDSLQYDTEDSYLMENEFMAYVMQQTADQVPDYFVGRYNRRLKVRRLIPEITSLIDDGNARVFVVAADDLGRYVQARWGLDCGRVHLLEYSPR